LVAGVGVSEEIDVMQLITRNFDLRRDRAAVAENSLESAVWPGVVRLRKGRSGEKGRTDAVADHVASGKSVVRLLSACALWRLQLSAAAASEKGSKIPLHGERLITTRRARIGLARNGEYLAGHQICSHAKIGSL
jgi:hypothetical protein